MKKIMALHILMLFGMRVLAQQDVQMSQHVFNSIFINPAYTGYKEDIYVQSFFRSQWMGLNGAPESFSMAADGTVKDANIGLGVMVTADRIGAQNNLAGYINYAYRIPVGDDETSHLSFGLAAGIEQLGIDGTKLNALQAGDPSVPLTSQSMLLPDANIGFFYSSDKNFVGVSATNLVARYIKNNNANNILVPVPQPHVYLTAGTLLDINEGMKLKPVFLIKDDFKGPTTLDLDASFIFESGLSLGAFYRSSIKIYPKDNLQASYPLQNAFGAMIEMFVTPAIRIGYSYDHDVNALGIYNYGSHELSVGFYINSSRSKNAGLRCYQF